MTFTLAMWAHSLTVMAVVWDRARTRNPIWGELRAVLALAVTLGLWVTLWSVTR